MLLAVVLGYTFFMIALGFWMGWYVRGAYPRKKK